MDMDHALRLAAGQAVQPGNILSVAGRLSGQETVLSVAAAPAPARTPAVTADNLVTLRACRGLLSQTISMLN
jgi:hypothetical protein